MNGSPDRPTRVYDFIIIGAGVLGLTTANELKNSSRWTISLKKPPSSPHVLNAISRAFASSFAFAELLVDRYEESIKHRAPDEKQ